MLQDAQLLLCAAQAFSADAGSGNVVDLGQTARRIGNGEPLCVAYGVDVAADHTTGNETYSFILQTDDDEAFGSPTDLATYTILYSALTLGAQGVMVLPPGVAFERYVRIKFVGGGNTPTVTITASIHPLSQVGNLNPAVQHYADGVSIQ